MVHHPHHSQEEAAFAEKLGYTLTRHAISLTHEQMLKTLRDAVKPGITPDLIVHHAFPAGMRAMGQLAVSTILAQLLSGEMVYKEIHDYDEILTRLREQYIAKFSAAFDEAAKKSLPKLDIVKALVNGVTKVEPKHGV